MVDDIEAIAFNRDNIGLGIAEQDHVMDLEVCKNLRTNAHISDLILFAITTSGRAVAKDNDDA